MLLISVYFAFQHFVLVVMGARLVTACTPVRLYACTPVLCTLYTLYAVLCPEGALLPLNPFSLSGVGPFQLTPPCICLSHPFH